MESWVNLIKQNYGKFSPLKHGLINLLTRLVQASLNKIFVAFADASMPQETEAQKIYYGMQVIYMDKEFYHLLSLTGFKLNVLNYTKEQGCGRKIKLQS